jgi:hypothetical protein
MRITEKRMQDLENRIPDLARKASIAAFQEVMASGKSVLVAKNDNVVEVFPNGSERIVGVLESLSWRTEKSADVKVFITTDPELLKQYYQMRHEVYCVENGWENYHSAENELDHKGKIIVAVKEARVVGGIRLLTSDWVEYFSNEVPGTEFTYRNFLKKFELNADAVISEISAFFVEKNHRDSAISIMMLEHAFEEAKAQNCIYNIGISTPLLNRSHRKDIKRLGYKAEIYSYPWKPQKSYNHVASCPIVAFLDKNS